MQPRQAPHCTQLQQEEEEDKFGRGGDEGRGQEGEEKGRLLATAAGAGDNEYLDEEGNPCLLFKLPQHINRPSPQLCIVSCH